MVQEVVPKIANEGNLSYNYIDKESRVKIMNYINCVYLMTNKLKEELISFIKN